MIEFDAKTHTYTVDGKEVPSVSELLRFAHREVYEEPDKFLMDQAADRGTRVHKATQELDDTGQTEADPDIEGYVAAYVKFIQEKCPAWGAIEQIVDYQDVYCGTVDRVGVVEAEPVILDIKTTSRITSKHKILYGAQLTAYAWALNDYCGYNTLMILQLKKDGTYKLIKIPRQDSVVDACVALHAAFETTKRRKKNG